MAQKCYGEDGILRLLRGIEVHCSSGIDVVSACRKAGISEKTYYGWPRKYGDMNASMMRSCCPIYDAHPKKALPKYQPCHRP